MPTPNLDQLAPTLQQIDAASVSAPSGMPIATFLAEAETLGKLLTRDDIAAKIMKVGVKKERVDGFPVALNAAREAQAFWTQVRSRRHSQNYETIQADGEALRAEMLHACSWNLRRNARARESLKFVRQGDGTADLAQDLHDLAGLVENNLPAFDDDGTFDAEAIAKQARQIAESLMGETATYHHAFKNSEAKDVRDRAFTYLDDLVEEVREAGRYAYRGDEAMVRRFTSGYWRRYNQNDVLEDEPTEPDEPEQPVDSDTDVEPVPAEG